MKFEISANEFRGITEKIVSKSYDDVYSIVKNYISPKGKEFIKMITENLYQELKQNYEFKNKKNDFEIIFDLGEK